MTQLLLRDQQFKVDKSRLTKRCVNFKGFKERSYEVRSTVQIESFQIFLAALESKPYNITQQNVSDLFTLCEEFEFTELMSEIEDLRARQSMMIDEKARKRITGKMV
jgi:hypothetical protein